MSNYERPPELEERLNQLVENAPPPEESSYDAPEPSGWKPTIGGMDEGPTAEPTGEDPHTQSGGGQLGG